MLIVLYVGPDVIPEVFDLYDTLTCSLSVPLGVHDSPGTTHLELSDELCGRIARLPNDCNLCGHCSARIAAAQRGELELA